jgi:hypothetical protein
MRRLIQSQAESQSVLQNLSLLWPPFSEPYGTLSTQNENDRLLTSNIQHAVKETAEAPSATIFAKSNQHAAQNVNLPHTVVEIVKSSIGNSTRKSVHSSMPGRPNSSTIRITRGN